MLLLLSASNNVWPKNHDRTPAQHFRLDRSRETRPARRGRGQGRPAAAAGQDLLLTAPSVALPLVRRIAEHAYKAGAGLVTPILSDEEITLARYRYGHDDELRPRRRLALRGHGQGLRRATPRGSPSSATIRCCCRARIPPRSRAPARPIRSPTSRRWRRSPVSTSTGTSSPIRARPGPSRCSPTIAEDVAVAKLADAIFAASRVDKRRLRSRPGRSTTRCCASGPTG